MSKSGNKKPKTIDDLVDELNVAGEEVEDAANDVNKRDELLKLSESGELDKSVSYIKKASQKVIDRLYEDYERRRMQRANEFLTDQLISRFSSILGGLDAIESPESLSDELRKGELLKRDVYNLVESLTPYLPFIGILSGGVTTAKHIYDHKSKEEVEKGGPTQGRDIG